MRTFAKNVIVLQETKTQHFKRVQYID